MVNVSKIEKLYFNPKSNVAFGGKTALYRAAKAKGIKKKDVTQWLEEQPTYTLHKKIRRKFPRSRTIVTAIDEQWQADLADVSKLAKKNKKTTFLLCVIDVLSKYAWVQPLKNKTSKEIVRAFNLILKGSRRPKQLHTDKGSEFLNKEFKKLLAGLNIHSFTTENYDTKASIVERFQRTLKARLYRLLTHKQNGVYIDDLQDLVEGYNNTKHNSIGRTPASVNSENELEVYLRLYPKQKKKKPLMKIGDLVRISKVKGTFDKGYLPNWSREIFTIHSRVPTRIPNVYRLQDADGEILKGTFYEPELQKIVKLDDIFEVERILKTRKGKGGRKEVLVRWRGYPPKFDSWILQSYVKKVKPK